MAKKKQTEAKPWSDSYGDEDDYYGTRGGCIVPILIAVLVGLGSCMMVSCAKLTPQNESEEADLLGKQDTIMIVIGKQPVTGNKFNVSDCVIAWGKTKGVVNDMRWSKNDKNVIIYTVLVVNEKGETSQDVEFYESELSKSDCQIE